MSTLNLNLLDWWECTECGNDVYIPDCDQNQAPDCPFCHALMTHTGCQVEITCRVVL